METVIYKLLRCVESDDVLMFLYFFLQLISVSDRTKSIPERNNSKANAEVYFEALLPALGFSTFFVESTAGEWSYYYKDI